MAPKRKAFIHLGLDDGSGDFLDAALRRHATALAELGVQAPGESAEQLFRAAVEILRNHREWGYKRSDVEGAWTTAVRAGLKGRDTLVFSQPLLASARPEQAELLIDALRGFEVHLIVTVQAPDARSVAAEPARSLDAVLDTWHGLVSTPERLHVVIAPDRLTTWQAIGRTVGFGTASLRLDEVPEADRPQIPVLATRSVALETLGRSWVELLAAGAHDVVGDPELLVPAPTTDESAELVATSAEHALSEALREVERLTRRTRSLERRLEVTEKKRKKLKRRLSSVG